MQSYNIKQTGANNWWIQNLCDASCYLPALVCWIWYIIITIASSFWNDSVESFCTFRCCLCSMCYMCMYISLRGCKRCLWVAFYIKINNPLKLPFRTFEMVFCSATWPYAKFSVMLSWCPNHVSTYRIGYTLFIAFSRFHWFCMLDNSQPIASNVYKSNSRCQRIATISHILYVSHSRWRFRAGMISSHSCCERNRKGVYS